ncbi:MAG TPA: hypothetical protein VKU19_05760 [Bryobacteraceae bacterium]|nr:hypothetical protein [Bryobacteraceae bacterium]
MSQRRVLEQELAPAVRLPEPEIDREAVREQLERILANPLFSHSKRYPLLLRWVVERALEGDTSQLKERTLGVEVFGRHPNYDSNADPVVRITAGEIRKRIAQYYHEPGRETEVRIDLPTGSYVPEFHRPLVVDRPRTAPPLESPKPETRRQARTLTVRPLYAAILAVPLLAGFGVWQLSISAIDRFWRPFWDSSSPVVLCMGGAGVAQEVAAAPQPNTQTITVTEQIRREYVAFSDAMTLSRVAGLFQARNRQYSLRIAQSTTFADLRSGPVVLVAGFNNGWSMRMLSQLRYHFARDSETKVEWIEDRENPAKRDWMVDANTSNVKLSEDYALISRFLDPATERMVVVAAGLVQYGTVAAGEFLTNPKYLDDFARTAPSGWYRKNMQLVLATKVINGNSGPPTVVTSYFW